MAEEAKRIGALFVHYSTDYVFDGSSSLPYVETDQPNPISVYGKTKLAGEEAIRAVGAPHLIFRTAWVYGTTGRNFLLTILRLATEREELRIVCDQIGALTRSYEIANGTAKVFAGTLPARPGSNFQMWQRLPHDSCRQNELV
jgi:dTDP-4-dehydrorhamnose reductase